MHFCPTETLNLPIQSSGETIAVNLASGQRASVREVIDNARIITGLEIDSRDVARRLGDPSILVADAKHARELLGWCTDRSALTTIMTDAWRWHRKRFGGRNTAGVTVQQLY
jgi:UDP-glucose 4-epimerase